MDDFPFIIKHGRKNLTKTGDIYMKKAKKFRLDIFMFLIHPRVSFGFVFGFEFAQQPAES